MSFREHLYHIYDKKKECRERVHNLLVSIGTVVCRLNFVNRDSIKENGMCTYCGFRLMF